MAAIFELTVSAGPRTRRHCPVSVSLPALEGIDPGRLRLLDEAGASVPVQASVEEDSFTLHWVIGELGAGAKAAYKVSLEDAAADHEALSQGVRLVRKEHRLDVEIDGTYFTSYIFDPAVAKPYLGPIMGPGGQSYTRLDFETKEHPHHRSVWLGIGDVNGIDIWNEPAGRHGKQLLKEAPAAVDGPVFARIESEQAWTTFEGKAQVEEKRAITVYRTPAEGRIVDLDFTFTAMKGQVEFGATKEAGPLGIRMNESIKAANGGTIVNSYGSIGEAECWGKRAEWCDYYGESGGHKFGIAAFDHPSNLDFPTHWHVRDYGLLAANNLYFLGGKLLKPGQSLSYRHRILFHEGDKDTGRVADRYQDYIHPPKVEWKSIER